MTISIRFTILLLCLAARVCAQRDSTSISSPTKPVNLLPETRSAVFGLKRPANNALKWNAAAIIPLGMHADSRPFNPWTTEQALFDLSFEQKLGKRLSVEAGGGVYISAQRLGNDFFWPFGYRAELSIKHYSKKFQSSKISHLSGNYIELQGNYAIFRNINGLKSPGAKEISLRYGFQRRLFNTAYFNFGFGASSKFPYQTADGLYRPNISFHNFVEIGLARFTPTSKHAAMPYSNAMRSLESKRQMFKIDLLDAVNIQLVRDFSAISCSPTLAYERKLGKSPFSLNTEINGSLYTSKGLSDTIRFNNTLYSFGAALEPRWYFNQKRRIALGKSGNNLSGLYTGLRIGCRFIETKYGNSAPESYPFTQSTSELKIGVAPIIGFQYRFMQHGFVNIHAGVGLASQTESISFLDKRFSTDPQGNSFVRFATYTFKYPHETIPYFTGGLRLGWMF